MKKYEEYENMFPLPTSVSVEVTYVAYVDKGLKFFNTKKEAEDAGKYIAKEVLNKDEVEKYKKDVREHRAKIYNAWLEELKEECCHLTTSNTFDMAREFINDNCCCDDYDEIAEDMLELNNLAKMIKKGFTQK